jgi:hypothetical protein
MHGGRGVRPKAATSCAIARNAIAFTFLLQNQNQAEGDRENTVRDRGQRQTTHMKRWVREHGREGKSKNFLADQNREYIIIFVSLPASFVAWLFTSIVQWLHTIEPRESRRPCSASRERSGRERPPPKVAT